MPREILSPESIAYIRHRMAVVGLEKQTQLRVATGLSHPYLSAVMNRHSAPGEDALAALAEALKTTPEKIQHPPTKHVLPLLEWDVVERAVGYALNMGIHPTVAVLKELLETDEELQIPSTAAEISADSYLVRLHGPEPGLSKGDILIVDWAVTKYQLGDLMLAAAKGFYKLFVGKLLDVSSEGFHFQHFDNDPLIPEAGLVGIVRGWINIPPLGERVRVGVIETRPHPDTGTVSSRIDGLVREAERLADAVQELTAEIKQLRADIPPE